LGWAVAHRRWKNPRDERRRLLTLAEATPAKYNFVTKARVLNGHDSWAPMALAGGRLLARDLTQLVCLDITGAKP